MAVAAGPAFLKAASHLFLFFPFPPPDLSKPIPLSTVVLS